LNLGNKTGKNSNALNSWSMVLGQLSLPSTVCSHSVTLRQPHSLTQDAGHCGAATGAFLTSAMEQGH